MFDSVCFRKTDKRGTGELRFIVRRTHMINAAITKDIYPQRLSVSMAAAALEEFNTLSSGRLEVELTRINNIFPSNRVPPRRTGISKFDYGSTEEKLADKLARFTNNCDS